MRYLSVCSGIEAATCAWEALGWEAAGFAEIEKFPSAVLNHHYPKVKNFGDFTKIEAKDVGPIDLLVGGTPCQSFSVAGLRGGLGDARGNLALEFLRLADRTRPRWVVWENVPGVYSAVSHDAPNPSAPPTPVDMECDGQEMETEDEYSAEELHAFACFLAGLSELGYGVAYRTLDAQFLGVPQRRRRVFVVGYFGDWRRAAAVLFERQSLSGNPAPRREAGKGSTYDVAPCIGASGRGFERTGDTRGQDCLIPSTGDISHCLNAGGMGRQDYETETLVTNSLRAEGFDASEDGTGRGTPLVPMIAPTLDQRAGRSGENSFATSGGLVPIAFAQNQRNEIRTLDVASSLSSIRRGDAKNETVLAFAIQGAATRENPNSGPDGVGVRGDGVAYTVEARSEVQSVAYGIPGNWIGRKPENGGNAVEPMHDLAPNLTSADRHAVAFEPRYYTRDNKTGGAPSDVAVLKADASKAGDSSPHIAHHMAVRRLTPRECARLQGFPDSYLDILYNGKPAADGPKYKALGNSMAVPCMRWIGERIQAVESLDSANSG